MSEDDITFVMLVVKLLAIILILALFLVYGVPWFNNINSHDVVITNGTVFV